MLQPWGVWPSGINQEPPPYLKAADFFGKDHLPRSKCRWGEIAGFQTTWSRGRQAGMPPQQTGRDGNRPGEGDSPDILSRMLEIFWLEDAQDERVHIVMGPAPGASVEKEDFNITREQATTFGQELANCLRQPQEFNPRENYLIGNSLGSSGDERRLSGTL